MHIYISIQKFPSGLRVLGVPGGPGGLRKHRYLPSGSHFRPPNLGPPISLPNPEALRDPCGGPSGPLLDPFGPLRKPSRAPWEPFGPFQKPFGAPSEPSRSTLAALRVLFGATSEPRKPFGVPSEPICSFGGPLERLRNRHFCFRKWQRKKRKSNRTANAFWVVFYEISDAAHRQRICCQRVRTASHSERILQTR